jgi:hypothetical protein
MVLMDRKLIKKRRRATTANRIGVIFSHLERPAKMISRQMFMQAASSSPRIGRGARPRGKGGYPCPLRLCVKDRAAVWALEISNASETRLRLCLIVGTPAGTIRLLLAIPLVFG